MASSVGLVSSTTWFAPDTAALEAAQNHVDALTSGSETVGGNTADAAVLASSPAWSVSPSEMNASASIHTTTTTMPSTCRFMGASSRLAER